MIKKSGMPLLEVKNLKKYFPVEEGFWRKTVGYVKAIDKINLYINKKKTLKIIKKSNCGKTTLKKCILRAIEPTEGGILFRLNGDMINITKLNKKSLKTMRRYTQMIFQDPYSSLDSKITILNIINKPLLVNNLTTKKKMEERVKDLVNIMDLNVKHLKRYPHTFSDRQRQRIGITRALASNPKFIITNKPISTLNISIQAQTLNLLQDLQARFKLTYLFISHDLSVVEHISDRIAVMYVGKVVELANTEEFFLNPLHPYSETLLSALPKPDPRLRMKRIILSGEVANPVNPPSGCYFHPRCKYAEEICKKEEPG